MQAVQKAEFMELKSKFTGLITQMILHTFEKYENFYDRQ